MLFAPATLLNREAQGAWLRLTLHAPALATAQAGQLGALRSALPGSADPLLRQPLFLAPQPALEGGTVLLPAQTPAAAFVRALPLGTELDLLAPLGQGWRIEPATRTLALVGEAASAPALFALAHAALQRGLAVSLILGVTERAAAPPAAWLPTAVEYHLVTSRVPAAAALAALDEQTLRWADQLALALPQALWTSLAHRIEQTRLRWPRGFAQMVIDMPLPCGVGICDACAIETRRGPRLVCRDGPIVDLRDLTR